jgi:hypothetical protein
LFISHTYREPRQLNSPKPNFSGVALVGFIKIPVTFEQSAGRVQNLPGFCGIRRIKSVAHFALSTLLEKPVLVHYLGIKKGKRKWTGTEKVSKTDKGTP